MNKRGIVIFVGATGTGKSTSLAALIGHRNKNSRGHIVSIEDPIEFVHEHQGCIITQREVGVDTESFEVALKNTLRQAPDVILIGEIRTPETMQHAITFAETGHLVLATLHANNANQALDRISHFFRSGSSQSDVDGSVPQYARHCGAAASADARWQGPSRGHRGVAQYTSGGGYYPQGRGA